MGAEWTTIQLPNGAIPVQNVPGVYLLLPEEAREKYKYWSFYRRADGAFMMAFSKRIKYLVDDKVAQYNIMRIVAT